MSWSTIGYLGNVRFDSLSPYQGSLGRELGISLRWIVRCRFISYGSRADQMLNCMNPTPRLLPRERSMALWGHGLF